MSSNEGGDNPPESGETMSPNEVSSTPAAAGTNANEKAPLNAGGDDGQNQQVPKVAIKTADAKLEMGVDQGDNEYAALTKSQLMAYANDPFWVKLRWGLFILFWVMWVAMLVCAVAIIIVAPKCPGPEPKEWWQKQPIYEIYVKSFKDSDADGLGDLKGIESKVDYLASLGISAVWLSPIYKSPQRDNGYDVSDFRDIDPIFGTMQDFKDLVEALHYKSIKVIMDFIPNHSSEQHEWFQKSIRQEEPYTDYYVWASGSPTRPPNNWKSVFNGSAWEWNQQRRQYYLHQFFKEQPDLNVRNPKVVEELEDILRFWLDLGVDGFRMDAVAHLFEDPELRDEGVVDSGNTYASVDHKHTYNLPEVLELLRKFRKVLDEKTAEDPYNPRVMMTEAYLPNEELVAYYGGNFTEHSGDIAHLPLNLNFLEEFKSERDVTPEKLRNVITEYLAILPNKHAWPNFNLGNHDKPRVGKRLGHALVDAFNMIMLLLPGTPVTYYGDEIGMIDYKGTIPSRYNSQDFRDPARTPMQWNTQEHAGFSTGPTTWLPVNDNFKRINVETEQTSEESHLKVYQGLTKIRTQDAILYGSMNITISDKIFAFNRVRKGNPGYVCVVNLSENDVIANVTSLPYLPDNGYVHVRSFHSKKEDPGIVEGQSNDPEAMLRNIDFRAIPLLPWEGLVVTFVPQV